MLPDAIDDHARRERVLRAGQPLRPVRAGRSGRGVDSRAAGELRARSGSRAARSGRASRPRRGCGSRCRRSSCASRTPSAARPPWPAGSVSASQFDLQLVQLLPGDRLASAGRRRRARSPRACRGARRTRPAASANVLLRLLRSSRPASGSGWTPVVRAKLQEHLRCRNSPGRRRPSCCAGRRTGRCCERCRPGRNSRLVGIGSNL